MRFRNTTKKYSIVLLPIVFILLFVLYLIPGCAHYATGSVNDIVYDMSLDRPAVEGGIPWKINILMNPGSATDGNLYIDGVDFGPVHSGDRVKVDDDAVVYVNGQIRKAADL